jgi:aflatoxin B1 aldehyde reductase
MAAGIGAIEASFPRENTQEVPSHIRDASSTEDVSQNDTKDHSRHPHGTVTGFRKPVQTLTRGNQVGDAAILPGVIHFDARGDVQALLEAFHGRGYSHLDTAANYPGSEARLGDVGAPSRFVIDTKIKGMGPGTHEPAMIESSVEQSLADLKTDYVETMYLHVPDRQTPLEHTLKAMNDAFQQKKFKRFGLSNYAPSEVAQIVEICEKNGYVLPSVYQGQYNPLVRGGEKELFPLLRKHGIAFYGYR